MPRLQVVNIKCGGCANTITKSLESLGATSITIDIPTQTVSFEGDEKAVSEKLSNLGYPPANSDNAKSLLKKGISYVSCAIGKISK
jgi:copper chaperone